MDEPKQDVGPNHPDPEHSDGIVRRLLNPVVFIALINTFGVFALIGAAMLGMDNGVLRGMADSGFARGLITYLFAVVTIGTAVVLVVYALTTADHERFNRGKEVLSLLLGVFGTIVGFYFGSETQSAHTAAQLSLAQPMLSRQQIESGGQLGITTVISGGDKPYHIGFALGEQDLKFEELADDNGWINKTITVPKVTQDRVINIQVGAKDHAGVVVTRSARVRVIAKQAE